MTVSTNAPGRGWLCAMALLLGTAGCTTLGDIKAPDYAQTLVVAEAAMQAGEADAALAAYHEAAAAEPEQPLPWQRIALLQAEAGDWAQVVVAAQEVLRRDPDDSTSGALLLRGSLRLADRALPYLPAASDDAADVDATRDEAMAFAAQLIRALGDEAIPADVRSRLDAELENRLRSRYQKTLPSRQSPKAPGKTVADPLDVLGGN